MKTFFQRFFCSTYGLTITGFFIAQGLFILWATHSEAGVEQSLTAWLTICVHVLVAINTFAFINDLYENNDVTKLKISDPTKAASAKNARQAGVFGLGLAILMAGGAAFYIGNKCNQHLPSLDWAHVLEVNRFQLLPIVTGLKGQEQTRTEGPHTKLLVEFTCG